MSAQPNVPQVDMPRVDAQQFAFFDPSVGAHLVTADDRLAEMVDLLLATEPGPVAVDIETRGLDTAKFSITCVTVAFALGGDTVALLLDPLRRDEHRRRLTAVFDHAARLIFHGASFDLAPLYAHRLITAEQIRAKLGDTLVAARMIDTNAKAGRTLENLAVKYGLMGDDRIAMKDVFSLRGVRRQAEGQGWHSTDIDTPTYCIGAMSDTVATLRLWGTPGTGGEGIMAEAAKLLTSPEVGFGGCGRLTAADAASRVDDVQTVNAIVLARTARGYAVDHDFGVRLAERTEAETADAARLLADAGIRPGVGADLVKVLDADGKLPANWPRTDTGRLKADKKALSSLLDVEGAHDSPLITAHRTVAENEKVRKYIAKTLENAGPTGRMHPEIKILGASATGRMCLPEDQQLLTQRGVVKVDDIQAGDRTIGADGNWTTVRAVHRYPDSPLRRYVLASGVELVCTREHRWVTTTEYGTRRVRPLEGGERVRVELAPSRVGIDFTATEFDARAENERFAALVGLLATDGRCTDGDGGMRARVYQTEGGFYRQFLDVIEPDAIMYDRVSSRSPNRGPHHEIRLRTRWLRPRLEAAGITVEGVLHDSPSLVPWVLSLNLRECSEFLRAVWLSDGDTATNMAGNRNHIRISCNPDPLREAVRVAAYRLGYRTSIRSDPASEWGTRPRTTVSILQTMPGTRDMRATDSGVADVWCVTTDAGTFTAWGSDGPYLTGNSASAPEIQQFPSAARGVLVSDDGDWVSADWKSIEPVILATASGDGPFLDDMRAGNDPYEPVGVRAGVDRKTAKRIMLASMYGQGKRGAALQYGWPEDKAEKVLRGVRAGLPVLYSLIDHLRRQSKHAGYVHTLTGRVVDQRMTIKDERGVKYIEHKESAAPNHFCQGSALDVMHAAILELDRRGLSDHVHLWMHDEIVADSAIRDELADAMSTVPHFLQAVADHHGIEPLLAVDVNEMGPHWEYV